MNDALKEMENKAAEIGQEIKGTFNEAKGNTQQEVGKAQLKSEDWGEKAKGIGNIVKGKINEETGEAQQKSNE